jgi:hypothetical protein
MKVTSLLLSTAACAVPVLASNAPQNVRQDVNRLTLLHGPTFLSGPHDPKPATISVEFVKVGSERHWSAQPAPSSKPGAGAGPRQPTPPAEPRWEFTPRGAAEPVRDPSNLKFDAALPPAPKPDLLTPAQRSR